MKHHRSTRGAYARNSLSVLIAAGLISGIASAQSASEISSDPVDLESISVSGVRASIQKSLVDKRNAPGIVDAISAEDMGKFPDLNLSESLQRIPGITLDRNSNGEGRSISLRGLGPEFTRVEINGMSGMSNNTGGRFSLNENSTGREFNFEIFASELFSKATVYKNGVAEVDEGGLAGTVRLETPRPLDTQGTHASGSVLGNYSEIGHNTDPRTALLFSHNHHDVFGIAASLAWSSTDFVSNQVEIGRWRPFGDVNVGAPIPETRPEILEAMSPNGLRYDVYAEDRYTTGSTLTLQFRPHDNLLLTVDGLYGKLKGDLMILRDDMTIEGRANAPTNAVVENGILTAGDFTNIQQRIGDNRVGTNESYRQMTARMEWTPDEYWSIQPMLGLAKRGSTRSYELFSFRLADNNGVFDPGIVSYRLRGNFVDFNSTHTNLDEHPEEFLFNGIYVNPSRDQDQEKQARVDVARHFQGHDHILKFGLRYSDRTKHQVENNWDMTLAQGVAPSDVPNLSSVHNDVPFKVTGANPSAPPRLLNVVPGKVWDVFMPGGAPLAGTMITQRTGSAAQRTWSIQEKTSSAWAQMDLVWGQWTLIPGLRFVRTQQISSGFDVANANEPSEQITPVRIDSTHHGYLPSVSARYDVTEGVVLRSAYARTLTRPAMVDLAPSEIVNGIDASGGSGARGNPELEPYHADNLDIGAEWYFSSEGLLAINAFYKKIDNFIDKRTFTENRIYPSGADNGMLVNGPITFTEPVNGVSASVKGFEVSMQSRFSKLPGIWGNLGGIINYSHADSSADFATDGDVRSQGLPGLSKNSINAVLYYDDGRFDARLAYAWRDRYLAEFADGFAIPRFTDDYGQLDLSLNYQLNRYVSFQAQILNLTEEQRIDLSTVRYLPYGVADVDRRFLLGFRVAF